MVDAPTESASGAKDRKSLRIQNKEFELLRQLGKGSFGECYLYRSKTDPAHTVAVKIMFRTQDNLQEMTVHRQMDHPNIVRMIHMMEVKSLAIYMLIIVAYIYFNLRYRVKTVTFW